MAVDGASKDVEEEELCIYEPSPNYYINEEAEPIKAKMINIIDDIPSIIMNTINDDDKNISLIHDENDLITCCFDLIKSGSYPKIKLQGNRFTSI